MKKRGRIIELKRRKTYFLSPGCTLLIAVLVFVVLIPGIAHAALTFKAVHFGQDAVGGEIGFFDQFGYSLSVGDFDGNGINDLAIGAPGEGDIGLAWDLDFIPGIDVKLFYGSFGVMYGDESGYDYCQENNCFTCTKRGVQEYFSCSSSELKFSSRADDMFFPDIPPFNNELFSFESYGHKIVAGDFNSDGVDELAIGSPGEWIGYNVFTPPHYDLTGLAIPGQGLVTVMRRNCSVTIDSQSFDVNGYILTQPDFTPEFDVRFGEELVVGDFNNDGADDLAIGVPEGFHGGKINMILGRPVEDGDGECPKLFAWHDPYIVGERGKLTKSFDQGEAGVGNPELGDAFGDVLAVGDFNGDGYDDLATGTPYEDRKIAVDAGSVGVIFGGPDGLLSKDSSGSLRLPSWWADQETSALGGLETGDHFGKSLAVGDFDADGYDDLAIGAPGEDIKESPLFFVPETIDAGWVAIIYGSATGLNQSRSIGHNQKSAGLGGIETGDNFGYSLAAGDFDNDGYDDLAIGSPYEDGKGKINTGYVGVVFGSSTGLDFDDVHDKRVGFFQSDIEAAEGTGDLFGFVLTAGDLGSNLTPGLPSSGEELIIGTPHENSGIYPERGKVSVVQFQGSPPIPDITANGSDGPVTISLVNPLTLKLQLNANMSVKNADWWCIAKADSSNIWYFFDLQSGWIPGSITATYQGPLADFGPYDVFHGAGLPLGTITVYFGVDMNMNGLLDMDQMYYDSVKVNITQ